MYKRGLHFCYNEGVTYASSNQN